TAAPDTTTAPDTTAAPDTTEPMETTTTSVADECGPESDVWHQPGTLTVATGEPAFPPYVIDDDPYSGEGFESAVVYAVAEELGFAEDQVEWVRTTFDEAIAPGEKPYDFNIQQYSITEERDEIVDFSIPYYTSQKTLVALAESDAASATTFADLEDVSFGATIGTTDLDYIVEVIGIPDAEVAIYNDQAATFAALDAGQIDATVIGLPTALFITAVEMPQATIAGVLPRAGAGGDEMGMLFEEGNPAVECVNEALQTLTDDGTLAAIDEQWMQSGGDIPLISES
ncbi:MAG TPA: ABC transporter substrate-binding protein, partial [Acidimicrobiia bacterium]